MQPLKKSDQRFMVSPDGRDAEWVHQAEVNKRFPGWTDCTDTTDDEFDALMHARLAANPLFA